MTYVFASKAKVYLVTRPSVDWEQVAAFLQDEGVPPIPDSIRAGDDESAAIIEISARLCYMSYGRGRRDIAEIVSLTPRLLNMSLNRMWFSYDEEADVLYVSFKKPSQADDAELTDDDVIIRYEKGEVIGITVLHASDRKTQQADT